MTSALKVLLPAVVVASLLGPVTPAVADTSPAPLADAHAVVDLTYDVLVAASAESGASDDAGFVTMKFSRPTAAPLPRTNPLVAAGLTISPGTSIVISVFSSKRVNDSLCITGTSSKTTAVVYLSSRSKTFRPTTKRPHECAPPGHAPILAKPAKRLIVSVPVQQLTDDLRIVSIGEESYATDNEGAYVADTLSATTSSSATDPLMMQGVKLHAGETVVATVYSKDLPNDTYCLTATSVRTKTVLYLSSTNGIATTHRPKGCVLPAG